MTVENRVLMSASLDAYDQGVIDGKTSRDAEIATLTNQTNALKEDLAMVSEELGLPPTIGPARGEIKRIIASRDAEVAELKVVSDHNLAIYHKAAQKLREQVKVLRDELFRVKGICLREVGIGIVNEVALAATEQTKEIPE